MRTIFTGIFAAIFLMLVAPQIVLAANIKVPILMYHFIADNPNPKDTARNYLSVSPQKFEAQMDYLAKNGYTPISLDTLYGIFNKQTSAPLKPIILTFDDGYIDFYTNAYPILKRFNFNAVSFISTGLIGGRSYYMNWDQIKEIQRSNLVTFEGHGVSHISLSSLSTAELTRQLAESKKTIEGYTNYPVNFIAYPFGASNSKVQNAARGAGYVGGLGTWNGKASGRGLNLPRIRITGYMSLKEFISRL